MQHQKNPAGKAETQNTKGMHLARRVYKTIRLYFAFHTPHVTAKLRGYQVFSIFMAGCAEDSEVFLLSGIIS